MKPVLQAVNLKKCYGDFQAVKGINFSLYKDECLAILGTNGAGKTSTMKMIYSASPISGGSIQIDNLDVKSNSRDTKRIIGIVSQEDLLDLSLTVIENLIAHAICFDIPKKKAKIKAEELLEFVGLSNYLNKPIANLSGGMKRRVVLARSLINDPKIIILDEPTTGLDIQSRQIIWKKLLQLKSNGISILLTSHHMDEVEKLADRIVIIHQGEIVAEGTSKDLIEKYNFSSLEETFLFLTGHDEEAEKIVQALS
ncbi:ABC transporter ATP-binding protein [Sporosarcina sp. ANT_H38]|uniref:ABC transporter ATP-binding protein n=1 Tax=unclassified Sporosarcina TaxID=2647733 RepID=UPI0011F2863E|nr:MULTISPECIES: ABC transporter ATP-binding protein [unclassified Sporosarcina]KAA0940628.1 ABC transporter ATP-binding protein [Sporosarcina sp. ANT_H38]QJS06564.1 Daunorubicin/doxorubicin resistance ATP-binding protein, ABC transporter [Sporosarcina sp.]